MTWKLPPRPAGPILALVRHRDVLVQTAGTYVQRMQKVLTQMNLLLPRVVSDIVGKTGLAILRDLVGGERDPHVLAQHRDPHCKATEEEIVAALTGHDRPEHLFLRCQSAGAVFGDEYVKYKSAVRRWL